MKKTLALVLVLALALTLSIVAFAEGVSEDEKIAVEATTEAEAAGEAAKTESADEVIEEPVEEPSEDETIVEAVEEETVEEVDADPIADWMELLDPSWGISEDEWLLNYVLSYVRVEWAEDAEDETPAEIYTNVGTEDITLDIYWEYGVYTPITDWEAYWATFDPDVTDPHELIGTEIVTIKIPAGESVYVSVNAEMWQKKDIARSGYIGGSYGDVSVYVGWNY